MSRGVNKAILVGNLGKDPETRYTANGMAVCNFSIATSEQWADKQTGEKQERTEWHRITIFGKLAEIAGEYLRKGKQVYIEGKIKTDKYTNKEGVDVYTTGIIADVMQMLGSNEHGDQRQAEQPQRQATTSQRPAPAPSQRQAPPRDAPPQDDFDESSVPF